MKFSRTETLGQRNVVNARRESIRLMMRMILKMELRVKRTCSHGYFLVNAIANTHKDPSEVKQGWTITYPYGNFTGGEAVLLDLGLNKTANPDQMDAT